MVPWLDPTAAPHFPPPASALTEPDGLLAAGGALTPDWLLTAYLQGIFPWFSAGEPILWWSPDPRMVLRPGHMRISHSLRKLLRSNAFEVRCNTAFADVMQACAARRKEFHGAPDDEPHTWISPQIQAAYTRLHELGWAHSVEAWRGDELVGGLYGVALGRAFYGESMFHRVSNASKIAFAHLDRLLEQREFAVIDCQMSTPHLQSLGATEMPREDFVQGLASWTRQAALAPWPSGRLTFDWTHC